MNPEFTRSVANNYKNVVNNLSPQNRLSLNVTNGGANNLRYNISNLSHNVKNTSPENKTFNVSSVNYNQINSELDIDKVVYDMTEKLNEAVRNCGEGMYY